MLNYNSKCQYDIPEGYVELRVRMTPEEVERWFEEQDDNYKNLIASLLKQAEEEKKRKRERRNLL